MRSRLSNRQLALLHLAAAQLGLQEGAYRALLLRVAGVTSASQLGRDQLDAVLAELRALGSDHRPARCEVKITGARPGMASERQLALIEALWSQWSDGAGDRALDKWIERTVHVSACRFLTRQAASVAIDGLKAMVSRKRSSGMDRAS